MKADGDTLWLHQSDIGHFMQCPDQFRVVNGILPGGDFEKPDDRLLETDAATVGTVFHAVVEHHLSIGEFQRVRDAQQWGRHYMADLIMDYMDKGVEYRTESFGDPKRALDMLDKLVAAWYACDERKRLKVYAGDEHALILEHGFDVEFLTNRQGRYSNVRLAGTIDVVDFINNRIIDWKTSSQPYKRWEKQRWAVQPTVYTFGAKDLIDPFADGYQFDYRVFVKRNPIVLEEHTVWREQGQWSWLVQQVSNMVAMIESDLPVWPVRDDHALCGPKWCPIWQDCKGLYVTEEWT